MRCPSCRKPITGDGRFCSACGYQLRDRGPDVARRAVIASAIVYAGVFGALFATSFLAPEESTSTIEELLWSGVAYGGMILVGLLAASLLGRDALRESFAGRPSLRWLTFGMVGGLACFAISAGWVWSITTLAGGAEAEPPLEGPWLALFASTVILPAFVEEWTDRGVLWVALREVTGTGGTIFATALLFAMSHGLGGGGLWEVPHRFAVGLILGWLRARSGSLWPGILAHAVINTLVISL